MESDLNAVLSLYASLVRPLEPPEPLGNAGGMSGSRLWRYRSGRGRLLVRAWPHDGPGRAAIERVHGWLAEAAVLPFVPVPLATLDGRTLHERSGCLWEITPWMPGLANGPSPERVRAGFAALAAFHQRLAHHATPGKSPGLQVRLREVEWLLSQGFATFGAVVHRPPRDALAELAGRWIDRAQGLAPEILGMLKGAADRVVLLQPCLRDVRPAHLLFTGERLTGLVDFGAMGQETVAADLARLASEWLGRDRPLRASAFDAYHALRPISSGEAALIEVFERSAALLGTSHWLRWHYLEGRRFEDPAAVMRGVEKGLDRLIGSIMTSR